METDTISWKDIKINTTFHLPKFVESLSATEEAEDWSKVRSPARAKRRLKRGFQQNIRRYRKPACFFVKAKNTYYIHPELAKELRNRTKDHFDSTLMKSYGAILHSGSGL